MQRSRVLPIFLHSNKIILTIITRFPVQFWNTSSRRGDLRGAHHEISSTAHFRSGRSCGWWRWLYCHESRRAAAGSSCRCARSTADETGRCAGRHRKPWCRRRTDIADALAALACGSNQRRLYHPRERTRCYQPAERRHRPIAVLHRRTNPQDQAHRSRPELHVFNPAARHARRRDADQCRKLGRRLHSSQ